VARGGDGGGGGLGDCGRVGGVGGGVGGGGQGQYAQPLHVTGWCCASSVGRGEVGKESWGKREYSAYTKRHQASSLPSVREGETPPSVKEAPGFHLALSP